jgi:hypothetical protein
MGGDYDDINSISGSSIIRSFTMLGKNTSVGTTLVDLIGFGSGVITYPNASSLAVVSDVASNRLMGIGIQKVKVVYLDSGNSEQVSDEISLNGTTQVTVTRNSIPVTDCNAVNDFFGTQVGSNLVATGNITVINTADTETYRNIPIDSNRSLDGFYTVPNKRRAWYRSGAFGVSKAVGIQDMNILIRSDTDPFDRTLFHDKVFTYDLHLLTGPSSASIDMGIWLQNPAGSTIKFSGILDTGIALDVEGMIGVYITG